MTRRLTSRMPGALLAIGACALSLAGASGCFFEPREPEVAVPFDSLTTRWRQANDPAILVNNVKVTFEDQQITFYERSFHAETFVFVPDPQDRADFAAQSQFPFEGYGLEEEKRVAETIFNDTRFDHIFVEYDSLHFQETGVDTARWRYSYELFLVDSISADTRDTTSRYAGVLTFFMRDFGSEWRLYAWEDLRSGEPIDTWGKLRGDNVN